MFFFIEVIAFIILCVTVSRLSARVGELEKKVGVSQVYTPQSPPVPAAPVASSAPAASFDANYTPAPIGPIEPTAGDRLSSWLKEDWLLKVGAFIVLLGFGWLTTYAFMNNWIGPMGRITLGIFTGAVLMIFGFYWMRKCIAQGGVFLVLGSATVILTIFAARSYYDFFTPLSALTIMFLCAAFVALASVRYHTRHLALISMILAGLTPLMIGGDFGAVAIFVYLLAVTLGTVWVVALTGWRVLIFTSLIIVSLYSVPHWASNFVGSADAGALVMLAYAFAALFFIAGTFGVLKSEGKERLIDLVLAGGNGIFLLLWIMSSVPDEWQSLVIAAWMVVFAAGGFAVFRATREATPFLLYSGVAVMFLAAATAIELEGAALILAFAFEAGIIPILLYFLVRNVGLAERACLLLIVPVAMSVPYVIGGALFARNAFGEGFAVMLCMALILLFVGMFFRRHKDESPVPLTLYPVMIVAGLVYVYVLIWNTLHQVMYGEDEATMASLLIYTIIGLITYFQGKSRGMKYVQMHGSILLGFVVGRLLLVDIWAMEMGGRIVTFFVVGALLMTTAFVGRNKKVEK